MDTIYSLKDEVQELKQVSLSDHEHRSVLLWSNERIPPQMLSSEYLGLAVVMLHLLSSFSFFKDNKRMRRTLEEEQRARKELERIIRRVLKNMNDPSWDETNL